MNLARTAAAFALLIGDLGPLSPAVQGGPASTTPDAMPPQLAASTVTAARPAPIATPLGGTGADGADPSIGGAPVFLPYTPPKSDKELPDHRTQTSRTIAKPDGSFVLEETNGPINYQDAAGAWQPIDLRLVPSEAGGYKVSANSGLIGVDTAAGELGAIEIGGHRVAISAPGYSTPTPAAASARRAPIRRAAHAG